MFGTLNNIKSVYFRDLTYVFDTRMTDVLVINDFHFEAGLQYHHSFTKNRFLNAGLMCQIPYNMNARHSFAVERFVTSSTGAEVTRDTVHFDDNVKGKIHMPLGIGGGVAVGVKNYWTIGLDVAWQNWDDYTIFGNQDSLTSSLKAGFGFSVTPPHSTVSNYFRKVAYRGGARYENSYLDIHGRQISEYAFSVGFGFPFRKTGSGINLSFEIGQRGTTRDDLIKETFVRGVLGLSIKEKWFTRRKLD
jgi:long-subunit fatty acid transport protein